MLFYFLVSFLMLQIQVQYQAMFGRMSVFANNGKIDPEYCFLEY